MSDRREQSSSRLDRFVEYVSPGWQAKREWGRRQLAAVRALPNDHMAARSAAIQTRVSGGWSQNVSVRGGTAMDRRDLRELRNRGRRVYRESSLGRSILNCETDNVVADGFTILPGTDSTEFNKEVPDRWYEFLDNADVRGMLSGADLQRQAYRSPRRDGDGGIVLVDRGTLGESKLQYIPGDLISNPDNRADRPDLIEGIEVDPACRPVAFHVRDPDEMNRLSWTRVPARNFVYLTPELDDDLAVRGPSCYATILGDLDGLENYKEAVIIAARMAAVFGLIFKTENPAAQVAGLGNDASVPAGASPPVRKAMTFENGMARFVGQQDDVVQVVPQQPMAGTPEFVRSMLRLIGIPFDMPLELVAKDMSTVNFASARIGLLGYYRACRVRQDRFVTRCLERIYQWWISRERKRQLAGLPGAFKAAFPEKFWPHKFLAQAWDYTDPVSEAQADQLQIDMGIKSPQLVCAERGRNFHDLVDENRAALAARRLIDTADKIPLPTVFSTMTRPEPPVVVPGKPAPRPPGGPNQPKENPAPPNPNQPPNGPDDGTQPAVEPPPGATPPATPPAASVVASRVEPTEEEGVVARFFGFLGKRDRAERKAARRAANAVAEVARAIADRPDPQVTVNPPAVHVEVQPAAVQVNPPTVTVNVPPPPPPPAPPAPAAASTTVRTVERDEKGLIKSIREQKE